MRKRERVISGFLGISPTVFMAIPPIDYVSFLPLQHAEPVINDLLEHPVTKERFRSGAMFARLRSPVG
jgi:hypothetical protein